MYGLEGLARQVLLEQQVARGSEHQRKRHREEDARPEGPLVKAAEHPRAALAGDFDRFLAQDPADELRNAGVLRVESVRSDVEMEIAVVKRSRQPAYDRVLLDHGDVKALPHELIGNREASHAGSDNGH